MKKVLVVGSFALFSAVLAYRQGSEVSEMTAAANHFLASVAPEEGAKGRFALQDEERSNWHYIPRERKGIPLKTMTPAQRKLAHAFLATGLGQNGYVKAIQIMFLEQILYEAENRSPRRDPDGYFFSVFGDPSETGPWGWRVEGHHLSINFTVNKGQVVSATPLFLGANPAEVKTGPNKGLRILAPEEELARDLLKGLSEEQRKKAIIATEAPADIITKAERRAQLAAPVGLPHAEMSREQLQLLTDLINEYAQRLRPEIARVELEKLREAGLNKIHFAWAGGTERGQPHYYRVHGPTFVIEYDNTQNNANHIHSVWRNFEGDFGGVDVLREHHAQNHTPAQKKP